MKKIAVLLLVLVMIFSAGCSKPAEETTKEVLTEEISNITEPEITEPDETEAPTPAPMENNVTKQVGIYRSGVLSDQKANLRFFDSKPNVAYIGLTEYFKICADITDITVEYKDNGVFLLTRSNGVEAFVDVGKNIFYAKDLTSFGTNKELFEKGTSYSLKDSSAQFIKIKEIVYENEALPVNFDFGKYGISLYGDEEDVYLPLSLLSSIFTDIALNCVVYNGESLYVTRKVSTSNAKSFYMTEYFTSIFSGEDRAADLTEQTYAELCFVFDYLYGYPGTAPLNNELREKGLDKALDTLFETGAALKAKLKSADITEYFKGLLNLEDAQLKDGHNSLLQTGNMLVDSEYNAYLADNFYQSYLDYVYENVDDMAILESIKDTRSAGWGRDNFFIVGDTAYLCLDDFNIDEDGWAKYYSKKGSMPDDSVGLVYKALKKAYSEKAENFVFDLTVNKGGYTDSLAAIIALISSRGYLCGENTLTKQKFKVYYDVDRNFDGVFDEKDNIIFDFNYAVITSKQSFSCGNLFPFIMSELECPVIGEKSGGGSCALQKFTTSEGFEYIISSYQWHVYDERGIDVEDGAPVDCPIDVGTKTGKDSFGQDVSFDDYSKFYDVTYISETVRNYYLLKGTD